MKTYAAVAAALLGGLLIAAPTPSKANIYDFDYETTGFSITGTLYSTISGTNEVVTGAGGVVNSTAFNFITNPNAPGTKDYNVSGGYFTYDDLLLGTSGTGPYLTTSGLLFSAGGFIYNVFYEPQSTQYSAGYYLSTTDPNGAASAVAYHAGTFGLREVPGPIAGAGLPGIIFASCGLLAWLRRRRYAV